MGSPDIGKAIENVVGDLAIPHRAFVISPRDDGRELLNCLVEPISTWALRVVMSTLDSRGAEAAYEFYLRIEGSPPAANLKGRVWEEKVHQYFRSDNTLSFTIRSLEDDGPSTIKWEPFKNMLMYNFGPKRRLLDHLRDCIRANRAGYFQPTSKNFASFDAIIYQPGKALVNAQTTENYDHGINPKGAKKVQSLLSPFDKELKGLRPVKKNPWLILFVVPTPMQNSFKKQKFRTEDAIWKKKTRQYVLGLDKYAVFHPKSK
jgi:hypothetical protein